MTRAPLPAVPQPRFNECSRLRPATEPDSLYRIWRRNEVIARQTTAITQDNWLGQRRLMAMFQRHNQVRETKFYPFKICWSPLDTANPDLNWRTFRVRAGAYGRTPVTGTDGADQDPYNPATQPTNVDYDGTIDFVVPESLAQYFVYVDATSPDAPILGKSDTIPGSGTDSEWDAGTYFLIGVIDTNTDSADKVAHIRQYIGYDIPKCP